MSLGRAAWQRYLKAGILIRSGLKVLLRHFSPYRVWERGKEDENGGAEQE